MKKPSTELFNLIKAMSKAEKIHFKLFVNSYSKSRYANYLLLYDKIDQQAVYDESKIKLALRKSFNDRYYAYEKNNLYSQLCRSLIIFHRDKLTELGLSEQVQLILLLQRKGLLLEVNKRISKTIKIADNYELFEHLQMLLINQRDYSIMGVSKESCQSRLEILNLSRNILTKQKNLVAYWEILQKIYLCRITTDKRNSGERMRIMNLAKNPLLLNEKSALSTKAELTRNSCNHHLYGMNSDYRNAAACIEKNIAFFNANPDMVAEEPYRYANDLMNHLAAHSHFESGKQILKKYRQIQKIILNLDSTVNKEFAAKRLAFSLSLILNSMIHNGKYENVEKITDEIKFLSFNFSQVHDKSIRIQSFYNAAYCLFVVKNYKEALSFLNYIVNDKQLDQMRGDHHCLTRILTIMTHYELNNNSVLDYIISSSSRFLKKKDSYYEVEHICMKHFRIIAEIVKDTPELNLQLENFKSELKLIVNNSAKIPTSITEELIPLLFAWIQSKASKVSVSDALKDQKNRTLLSQTIR